MPTMTFQIVGPNANATILETEFGVPFINGRATVPVTNVHNLCVSMERGWNAYPVGSSILTDAQREWEARNGGHQVSVEGENTVGSQAMEGNEGDVAGEASEAGNGHAEPDCGVEEHETVADDGPGSNQHAVKMELKHQRIRDIVAKLPKDDDTCWTKSGLPAIEAVQRRLGSGYVTRKDIEISAPGVTRN